MTVYVDDWFEAATVPNGKRQVTGQWSHMYTGPWDDPEELHELAARIRLQRRWYQDERYGKKWPSCHYDVTAPKRLAAINAGAVPVTWRQTGLIMPFARRIGPLNRPLPVITVRQPWATAITDLDKDRENRTWVIPDGYLWLHAGARTGWDTAGENSPLLARAWRERLGIPLDPESPLIPFGGVVALAKVTGHHHAVDCEPWCSPWAVSGQVHNTIEVAAVLPDPVTVRGKQKLTLRLPRPTEDACLTLMLQAVMNGTTGQRPAGTCQDAQGTRNHAASHHN